jgi:hypothetical protein
MIHSSREPPLSLWVPWLFNDNADKVMKALLNVRRAISMLRLSYSSTLKMNDEARGNSSNQPALHIVMFAGKKTMAKATERTSSFAEQCTLAYSKRAQNDYIALSYVTKTERYRCSLGYPPERWRQVTDAMLLKKSRVSAR